MTQPAEAWLAVKSSNDNHEPIYRGNLNHIHIHELQNYMGIYKVFIWAN